MQNFLPSKSGFKTIAWTFALIWAVNNVGVLAPVRDLLSE